MKIILQDEYKSLFPFISEDLTDLAIITGKNGSGKTQLLYLIGLKANKDSTVTTIRLVFDPEIRKVQYEGLIKAATTEVNLQVWREIIDNKINRFHGYGPAAKEFMTYCRQNGIDTDNLPIIFSQDEEYLELLAKAYAEKNGSANLPPVNSIKLYHQTSVLSGLFNQANKSLIRFINMICEQTGKKEVELVSADFFKVSFSEEFIDNDDLFKSQIEVIFYNYAKRRDANSRAYFEQKEYNENSAAVSDNDFIKMHRPPWEVINEILDRHNIDFTFQDIPRKFSADTPMDFRLIKKSLKKPINFADLSSGEKVIIGLVLKLFTGEYYRNNLSFPDLLVLDEPDAPLHPEMSNLLIEVLHETFVKTYGIKVIFTTHSPSTIALAPDNCIYQLQNGPSTSLTKISKDEALKILTSFIPTLSIDYRNHRQVFVESPTDTNYYQTLYDKHSQNRKLDYKLYFISSVAGKGNCTQVYDVVRSLRKAGNQTTYGIVDWDTSNKPENFIHVHGNGERYSVENFILDPVYVITLLIQMNNAHSICEKTGLNESDNEYLIGHKPNEELQKIVDNFFAEIKKIAPAYKATDDPQEIQYFNGRSIKLPKWFLMNRGHDIVDILKKVFPALNKYKNEGEIQEELSIIMSKSYPFVPLTTAKLLESLAMHQPI